MKQNSTNCRQRFLSENTTLASCSPFVVSPPTPKIQPMVLDLDSTLEELSLEPCEDFESSPYRDFNITFSSVIGDECTVDERSSIEGEQAVEGLLGFLKLGKSRSRSFAAHDFDRSIYGYLQMTRATFN